MVRIFQDKPREPGLEVFFSYRMNGADKDLQYTSQQGSFVDETENMNVVPLNQKHPEWLIRAPWNPNGCWQLCRQRDAQLCVTENARTVIDVSSMGSSSILRVVGRC